MSTEEFDRRIAFIIEQQGQFASDILQLREAQAQTERILGETGEIVTRLAHATLEEFKDVNLKLNALVDSQIGTDQNVRRTDENLRNLVAVVDRYFKGRNGL